MNDNPSDAANIVGALATAGMEAQEIANNDQGVEAVSLTDLKQAARVLLNSTSVQGILAPMRRNN